MKKIVLSALLLIVSLSAIAQKKEVQKETTLSEYNKWTIEASIGQAKGVRPYSTGYFSSDPGTFFGKPQANSFSLATRYMFSPIFGVRGGLHFEEVKNIKNNGSLPFKMQQIGLSFQGVINANRLFKIEEQMGRLAILFHGGLKVDAMTSKTPNIIERDHNYNVTEYNGGLLIGVTPEFRISKKLTLTFDVTVQNNYRQHFNWDGTYSEIENNLNGQLITSSFGLTYSLGKNEIHGDYAIIRDKSLDEIDALNKRVAKVESSMVDSDKDGVADYLDQENNSVAGVVVDSKGRMVDTNRNGVPDELEKYIDRTSKEISEKSNSDMIKRLINEGYVTSYFDTAEAKPTNVSTEGIDFIRTYLKNNPTSSVDIIGHADEIGSNAYNDRLSNERAEAVKAILVKSGIDPSRLNIVGSGEDTSVAVDSEGARKLVRRVTFKVKD